MRNNLYVNGVFIGNIDIWNYVDLNNCFKLN